MTKNPHSPIKSIHYYLRSNNKNQDSQNSFNKIVDYFLTFIGDIEVKKEDDSTAIVYYIGTPLSSLLKLEETGQITVVLSPDDNVTINLIANIAKNISLRIYNPQTNSYLLNDPNIFDLTIVKVDAKILDIFKKYNLRPLYQYRESLIFFVLASDNSIHLVNRHLLEYLKENKEEKLFKDEFSIKIADSIDQFVALFDRGLVPLSFHKCKDEAERIINLSGLDLDSAYTDLELAPIYFSYDKEDQSMKQNESSNYPNLIDIKKGGSIIKSMQDIPYISLKIAGDIVYQKIKGKLIPKISISVFM